MRSNILIITGNSGSGKTQVLINTIRNLENSDIRPGGILAPGRYLISGEKEFDLLLVPNDDIYFLSARCRHPGWEVIGNFWFNPDAVEAGLNHLYTISLEKYNLYLLDEIGPYELEGLLWAPVIPILKAKDMPMILTMRSRILETACEKWGLSDPSIIDLSEVEISHALTSVQAWISNVFRINLETHN